MTVSFFGQAAVPFPGQNACPGVLASTAGRRGDVSSLPRAYVVVPAGGLNVLVVLQYSATMQYVSPPTWVVTKWHRSARGPLVHLAKHAALLTVPA